MKLIVSLLDQQLAYHLPHLGGEPVRVSYPGERIATLCGEIRNVTFRMVHSDLGLESGYGQLEALSRALSGLILPTEIAGHLRRADGFLTLQIEPRLQHIPWEWLHDGEDFWCRRFSIGRVHRQGAAALLREPARPVKMLVVVSDPDRDLPGALPEARKLVRALDHEQAYVARLMVNPTIEELIKNFNQYSVVHYVGHMKSVPGEDGPLPAWQLKNGTFGVPEMAACFFGGCRVRLVYSNACPGLATDPGAAATWPRALSQAGVQAVISTLMDVPDRSAAEMTAGFYEDLASGKSLGEVLSLARERARTRLGKLDITWMLHMLHGDPDQVLLPVKSTLENGARLRVSGPVPYKAPLTPQPPARNTWRRFELGLFGALLLLTAGLLARPLWERSTEWKPLPMPVELEPFSGRILFSGFEGADPAFATETLEAEQCFIRTLTTLPGVRLQDGRERPAMLTTPFMEISGRVVMGSSGEGKLLLMVKRTSDRIVLYADDFPLPMADETPCVRLQDWIRRKYDL
ncbi:MAG: hypothetical protein CVU65_01000 [Deltaproteobacteria bacterium HGW-Deltaproteobacteria-22]|jgi:hypothetical protein|nr:MAG: hypothetical protein CVU65_01000 [Deltaproteobacteria bacterium HGW-Deltaproteobacteria-22]